LHNSLLHLLLKNCDFLNTDISHGSVATHLVLDWVFKYSFVTNFLLNLTLKEFRKSVNIWGSYGQEFGVLFLRHSDRHRLGTLSPRGRRDDMTPADGSTTFAADLRPSAFGSAVRTSLKAGGS